LAVVAVEVLQVRLVEMDPARALKALLRMVVAVAVRVKQVGALALQVVVLVKIQRQHLVHLHKDLPELLGQVQPLQLAQVAAAEQVRLEFADSSIRNIQALNALQAVTAAMDFHIQFLDQLPITAVVVAAELITTPARRLILDMAVTVAAETEQMRIEETEPLVKQIQAVAVVAATGKQVAQMVDLELLLFVIPFQRVLRLLLHLARTLWCLSKR
jgi:hypothetical protein